MGTCYRLPLPPATSPLCPPDLHALDGRLDTIFAPLPAAGLGYTPHACSFVERTPCIGTYTYLPIALRIYLRCLPSPPHRTPRALPATPPAAFTAPPHLPAALPPACHTAHAPARAPPPSPHNHYTTRNTLACHAHCRIYPSRPRACKKAAPHPHTFATAALPRLA